MLKIVFALMVAFSYTAANKKPCNTTTLSAINCNPGDPGVTNLRSVVTTTTKYPKSYRDHVFYSLSEKGKKMFFAANIHPSCLAKKGQCIPRGKCDSKMLYISSICYHRDLVCCYDDTIRFPVIGIPPPSTIANTAAAV